MPRGSNSDSGTLLRHLAPARPGVGFLYELPLRQLPMKRRTRPAFDVAVLRETGQILERGQVQPEERPWVVRAAQVLLLTVF